jgi:phosphatidylserine decarboxylase
MMKTNAFKRIKALVLAAIVVTLLQQCASSPPQKSYSVFTSDFVAMMNNNPKLKTMLEESIEKAKAINPDTMTNPAQSLEQYYDFIEWAAKAMPWSVVSQPRGKGLYDKLDQSLCYFYFINDQPLDELKDKDFYNNSLQYCEPYRSWLVRYAREWGKFLSTPESWTDENYKTVYEDESFGLKAGWYEDPSNWHSFNDFFARYLKSPDMRPIASRNDNSVVISPADSKPQGVWNIDGASNIVQKKGVTIKSKTFSSVPQLLGPDSRYQNAFAGGTLTHSFLDVNDYHRYHFPLSGTIKEIKIIASDDAAGGVTHWDAALRKYVLDYATPGWQSIETRGCVVLDTPEYGLVALLPIGMSQVNSVNFEKKLKVGSHVKKGDMLGCFRFGGSDFVILFQKGVSFRLTAQQVGQDKYKHLLMGEELGRLTK